MRKAVTAGSEEQAAREVLRDDSAGQQPHGSEDPMLLASPETTGQAGRLPREEATGLMEDVVSSPAPLFHI